jgi:hypothetical protein
MPCSSSNFAGVGGTSVSSPAFAGLLALINQKTRDQQGNANYVLYGLAAKQSSVNCNSSTGPAPTCVFNDIISGTIAVPCVGGSPNCTPSNPGDTLGILAGYQAGPGYDLATGLGSVNAANLVNDWSSVSRTSSTTALTLNGGNAVSITHGTPVNVAVSVGPSSPEPTGSASLIATQGNQIFGLDSFALTGGTASGTTNMLPGGTSYSVRAHYGGDANYGGSDSSSTMVTVSPEASTTNVHIATIDISTGQVMNENASSLPYGSLYVLRADVENSSGTSCYSAARGSLSYACPTGTVSFTLDGTSLGSAPSLNSQGFTENPTVQLTGGSHSFAVNYSGDNSYLASSGTASLSVTPAPTVLGPESNSALPIGSHSYNLFVRSANIGKFPSPPTGTFTIFDGSTQLSSTLGQAGSGGIEPSPNSPYIYVTFGGNLNFTLPGSPGPHTLTLNYSGDANYQPATSGPFSVTEVYPTTLQLTPSALTILEGQPLTVTAQVVSSQNAATPPSGSVTLSVNSGNPLRTVPVTNGQASITFVPASPAAAMLIGVTYSGDANYAAASASFSENVTLVSTTTIVTASTTTVAQNSPVTFTAQVNPAAMGLAPLTGSVQFTANGVIIGNLGLSSDQAQLTATLPTPGQIQVQATYSGDLNYTSSAGTATETVTPAPDFSVTASGTMAQTVNAGQTATFANTITVAPLNGFSSQVNMACSLPSAAMGTVCSVTPNSFNKGSGTATVTVTTTARGLLPPIRPPRPFVPTRFLVPVCFLFVVALILFAFGARSRRDRVAFSIPATCILFFLLLQSSGCGGGGSGMTSPPPPVGTPAGSYTVTISGTSGATTHTATTTLVVN